MNVADIMTRSVITISPETSIADAVVLMLYQGISGVPVVDNAGGLVGMLTEGDLLRRTEIGTERRRSRWLDFLRSAGQEAEDYLQTHGRKVQELRRPTWRPWGRRRP
jgi:CBS-domain-containing membrane protein